MSYEVRYCKQVLGIEKCSLQWQGVNDMRYIVDNEAKMVRLRIALSKSLFCDTLYNLFLIINNFVCDLVVE